MLIDIARSLGCVGVFFCMLRVVLTYACHCSKSGCFTGGGPSFSSSSGHGDTDFIYRTKEGSIRSLSCSSNTAELRMFSEPSTAAS